MNNWDQFRYYLEVARQGSVSAASKSLGVSHPTILRQIDALEDDLGVKLFKRLQSGYQLSEEGEALLEKAALMQSAVNDIEQSIQKQSNKLAGVLKVTQTTSDCLNLFDHYAEFTALYPDITLEIDTSISLRNLNQQEFDVAIRFIDTPYDMLVGNHVGALEYRAYAQRSYLERNGGARNLGDLGWVIMKRSTNDWGGKGEDSAFAKLYRLVDKPRIILQADDYRVVESAVIGGAGVGFLSHLLASKYPDLVEITDHGLGASNHVWVLAHRDQRQSIKVRRFMAFITERLRKVLSEASSCPGGASIT